MGRLLPRGGRASYNEAASFIEAAGRRPLEYGSLS